MRRTRLPQLSHLLLLPLALSLQSQPASAGWPHDPRAPMLIAPNSGSRQTVEAATPDGNGGAFVFFLDDRFGQNDVFAYHILPNGDRDPAWPAFGLPICTAVGIQSDLVAVADGTGGAFVCWLDQRVVTPANYVTRVLASGVVAPGFPADGLLMAPTLTNGHRPPRAALDGMGGMVAVWEYEYSPTDVDIAGARILLDGSIAWHVELIPTTSNDVNPDVAVHQPGSISVAWMQEPDEARWSQFNTVSAALTGVAVLGTGADVNVRPRQAPDGWGGTFVAWTGSVAGSTVLELERVFEGNQTGYTPITGSPGETYVTLDLVYDGNYRNWLLWNAEPAHSLLATPITVDGGLSVSSVLFTASGLDAANPAAILPHTTGNVLVAFGRVPPAGATRLTIAGTDFPTWGALSTLDGWLGTQRPGNVRLAAACSDGNSGMLLFSHDVAIPLRRSYAVRVDRFGAYDGAPRILGVSDVAGDQGGRVRLSWSASYLEDPLWGGPIDPYRIWRQVPVAAARERLTAGEAAVAVGEGGEPAPGAIRLDERNGVTFAWEYVTSQIAANFPSYSITLESVADSSASGPAKTVFMVETVAAGGFYHWASQPDSGHSVDNLAPATPSPFSAALMGGANTQLTWGANIEADLAGYELHRGSSSDFVPGAGTMIATPTGTSFLDVAATGHFYKLAAVDVHGNRSGWALVTPQGTLDAPNDPAPREFSLAVASANPARDGAAFRYSLPAAGEVSLALYDVHGRLVRELVAGVREAGSHASRWDGREAGGARAASGIYFARLAYGGKQLVRRIALSP